MNKIYKNPTLKFLVLIKSKFGEHAVKHDFEEGEIIPPNPDKLPRSLSEKMKEIREVVLTRLIEEEDEDQFIDMICSKHNMKFLVGSNKDYLSLINFYPFHCEIEGSTIILAINLFEFKDEYFDVVGGDRTAEIEENLKLWIGSGFWKEGIKSLNQLMDYFSNFDRIPQMISRLESEQKILMKD